MNGMSIVEGNIIPLHTKVCALDDSEEEAEILLQGSADIEFFKKFAAVACGNILEWYDFSVFGAVADIIADTYFPVDSGEMVRFMNSLTIFGSAFLMRPIGGVLMGYIGDRYGRKIQLEWSVTLMLIPSILLAFLPTYAQLGHFGYLATSMLVLIRLVQGLAVGGELIGAYVYILEATKGQNKGFWGACCKASGCAGNVLGLGIVGILRLSLSKQAMINWGWRIAFASGGIFGLIGLYLRSILKDVHEDHHRNEDVQKVAGSNISAFSIFRAMADQGYYREVLTIIFVSSMWAMGYYSSFVWLGYFMARADLIGGSGIYAAWTINFVMNILLFCFFPLMGKVGDILEARLGKNVGYFRTMQLGQILSIAFALPAFLLIQTRQVEFALLGQLLFVIGLGTFGANLPAFMISKFPVQLRCAGIGLSYNLSNAVFAGSAPLIQTSLSLLGRRLGSPLSLPGVYLIFVGAISFCTLSIYSPYCDEKRKGHFNIMGTKETEQL